jgi:ubiquitin carboxyl-terminal hydrolase 5/13
MFKNLIGRGHPEFSGKQQQDAQEFFLHLLTVMERENRKRGQTNHAFSSLQFKVEDRLECGATKQVSYSSRIEDYMPLTIPVDMATNEVDYQAFEVRKREAEAKGLRLEPEETVRRIIPFEACLQQFCSDEIIDGYLSPVTKENTIARKTTRFRTFPDYLLIQLKKFDIDEKWQPYKLDVEVDMPDNIDLACLLKSTDGLQPGEVPMTKRSNNLSIGAPKNFCDAMAGAAGSVSGTSSSFVPDEQSVEQLLNFGFTRAQCVKALKSTSGNMERAADWLFNHPNDNGEEESPVADGPSRNEPSVNLTDGSSHYKLVAFISHMGTSTCVGHYVCHILKEGRWVIYNDEKVALSEKTPKKLGYLYLYERIQT